MRKLSWLLSCTAAMCLAVSVAWAEGGNGDPGSKPAKSGKQSASKPAKSSLKGNYAIMAGKDADLGLSDDQIAKLTAAVEAKGVIEKAWATGGEKGTKLAEAEKALQEAKSATPKDDAKIKTATTALETLKAERTKELDDADKAILAVLTPEQLEKWQAYELYLKIAQSMGKKVTLTDDEKSKIKTMAAGVVKDWAKAADDKAKNEIVKKLQADVEANVLTAEQRDALKGGKATSKPAAPTDKKAGQKKPGGE